MKKARHIYWFAHYNLSCPSVRYRGYYPLEYIRKHLGISYSFVYPQRNFKGFLKFLKIFMEVLFFRKKHSLIVIQKVHSQGFFSSLLKLLVWARPSDTLYDTDDADYIRYPTATLHYFLQHCAHVTVGSSPLATYAASFNARVEVLTTPVIEHTERKTKLSEKFTIGWVGDFGNNNPNAKGYAHRTAFYETLLPALLQLNFPVRLVLLGIKTSSDIPILKASVAQNPNIELFAPENLDWQQDDWVYPEITKFDIGVSPLTDHEFNRAKSAFRAKQYMSCGVPVIASGFGENLKFVKHNYNGLIATTPDDFYSAIVKFKNMPEVEYKQYCANALNAVSNFHIAEYARRLLETGQE